MKTLKTLLCTLTLLASANVALAGPTIKGLVTDVFVGEIDPFVLGDVCVVFIKADGKSMGLVMDESCSPNSTDSLVGKEIEVAKSDTSLLRNGEEIRILQRYRAGVFYLRFQGSLGAVADGNDCPEVTNLTTAKTCFKKFANKHHPEGEMPNSVIVSNKDHAIRGVVRIALEKGDFRRVLGVLATAEFVAVVNQHFDEDEYTYYVFNRGHAVKFEKVLTVLMPDLYYDWPVGVEPMEFALNTRGITDWHYEDFIEARKEALRIDRD